MLVRSRSSLIAPSFVRSFVLSCVRLWLSLCFVVYAGVVRRRFLRPPTASQCFRRRAFSRPLRCLLRVRGVGRSPSLPSTVPSLSMVVACSANEKNVSDDKRKKKKTQSDRNELIALSVVDEGRKESTQASKSSAHNGSPIYLTPSCHGTSAPHRRPLALLLRLRRRHRVVVVVLAVQCRR